MGQNEDDFRRRLIAFAEVAAKAGVSQEAALFGVSHVLVGLIPDVAVQSVGGEVAERSIQYQELMDQGVPAEVREALEMLGIKPATVSAQFLPRAVGAAQAADGRIKSGKYAGLECDCEACMARFGHMFHNGTDGEA